MTRLFTDGAEMGDILFWNSATGVTSTTQKRSGAYSYLFSNKDASKATPEIGEFYLRSAIYSSVFSGAPVISWKNSSTVLGSLKINKDTFYPEFYVGITKVATSNLFINLSTWYLLELHVKIADSGLLELKINGVLDNSVSYSGDTQPGADAVINNLYFYGYSCYVDDIAINDTSGSVDNSWCGDGHVIALVPDGVGDASELTPSSGSVNYLMVDEVPSDGDTTYVSGSVAETKDLYNFTPTGLYSGSHVVLRAFVETRTRDTSGSAPFATVIQSGSSVVEETTQYTTLSYASYKGTDNYLNPATGLSWTVDELDALQAGIVIKE